MRRTHVTHLATGGGWGRIRREYGVLINWSKTACRNNTLDAPWVTRARASIVRSALNKEFGNTCDDDKIIHPRELTEDPREVTCMDCLCADISEE